MINNILETRAEKLLREAKCYHVPVDIKCCTEHLKLVVKDVDLDDNLSGFLAFVDNNAIIGCNKKHLPVRKRFTIAHELAHFVLHSKDKAPIFIDKDRVPAQNIMFRDESSSTGEFAKEREANAFAAALLMPKTLVEEETRKLKTDDIDESISLLADKFQVSKQAMSIRLANLDIIDYNAV